LESRIRYVMAALMLRRVCNPLCFKSNNFMDNT